MSRAGMIWLWLAVAGVLIGPGVPGVGLPTPEVAFAEDTPEPPAAATEELPAVPHGKFLFDYLLVVLLVAGAVYAVSRKSRRV